MRKRSSRKERPVSLTAVHMAMLGAARLTEVDQLRYAVPVREAVDRISRGQGVQADWREVFDALNTLQAMVAVGPLTRGSLAFIEQLQQVVVQVCERQRATNTKALHAAERASLSDLAAEWARALSVCTNGELSRAQERVIARVQQILRSERPTGATVVEAEPA